MKPSPEAWEGIHLRERSSKLNPKPKRERGAPRTSLTLRVGVGFCRLKLNEMESFVNEMRRTEKSNNCGSKKYTLLTALQTIKAVDHQRRPTCLVTCPKTAACVSIKVLVEQNVLVP